MKNKAGLFIKKYGKLMLLLLFFVLPLIYGFLSLSSEELKKPFALFAVLLLILLLVCRRGLLEKKWRTEVLWALCVLILVPMLLYLTREGRPEGLFTMKRIGLFLISFLAFLYGIWRLPFGKEILFVFSLLPSVLESFGSGRAKDLRLSLAVLVFAVVLRLIYAEKDRWRPLDLIAGAISLGLLIFLLIRAGSPFIGVPLSPVQGGKEFFDNVYLRGDLWLFTMGGVFLADGMVALPQYMVVILLVLLLLSIFRIEGEVPACKPRARIAMAAVGILTLFVPALLFALRSNRLLLARPGRFRHRVMLAAVFMQVFVITALFVRL
ncbi:MAG: DUF2142 domain-containing protein [Lachnospiraceae bacterium]|nr:DUF2142 domain-containing protein [Lachnospiraceae bacterium]